MFKIKIIIRRLKAIHLSKYKRLTRKKKEFQKRLIPSELELDKPRRKFVMKKKTMILMNQNSTRKVLSAFANGN